MLLSFRRLETGRHTCMDTPVVGFIPLIGLFSESSMKEITSVSWFISRIREVDLTF